MGDDELMAWNDFFWQMPEWARSRVLWLSEKNPGMLAVDLMAVMLPELQAGNELNPDGTQPATLGPAMSSVGSELLNEIERVSRKHERWLKMMNDHPEMRLGMTPGATLMKLQIDEAKAALQGDDPARAIRALENLRGYDDND